MRLFSALAFVAGFAVLVLLVVRFGAAPIASACGAMGVGGMALVVAAHLPVAAMLGLAWWSLGRGHAGARPPRFIWARLVRDAAGEVLPFSQVGGFVIGARALTVSGVAGAFAAISTVFDLLIEFAAKLPYVLIGLVLLKAPRHVPTPTLLAQILLALAVGAAPVLLVVIIHRRRPGALERLVMRIAGRWPALRLADTPRAREAIARLLANDGRSFVTFVLHFTAWVLGGAEAWIAFHLMGARISLAQAVVIDSLFTGLRGFAFFVPATVGVQEAAYVALGALFGVTPGVALAFSLTRRARDFLIGAPCLLAWQMVEGRRALLPTAPAP
jgi:putative membrane protein